MDTQFVIYNLKTGLGKAIKFDDYSVIELDEIYKFYSNHQNFIVIFDGEVDL